MSYLLSGIGQNFIKEIFFLVLYTSMIQIFIFARVVLQMFIVMLLLINIVFPHVNYMNVSLKLIYLAYKLKFC